MPDGSDNKEAQEVDTMYSGIWPVVSGGMLRMKAVPSPGRQCPTTVSNTRWPFAIYKISV